MPTSAFYLLFLMCDITGLTCHYSVAPGPPYYTEEECVAAGVITIIELEELYDYKCEERNLTR